MKQMKQAYISPEFILSCLNILQIALAQQSKNILYNILQSMCFLRQNQPSFLFLGNKETLEVVATIL